MTSVGGGEEEQNASHRGNELQLAGEGRGGAFPLHDLRRNALLTLPLSAGGGGVARGGVTLHTESLPPPSSSSLPSFPSLSRYVGVTPIRESLSLKDKQRQGKYQQYILMYAHWLVFVNGTDGLAI
jgi:hypothetical protein